MATEPVVLRPRLPALSRAGTGFIVFGIIWMVAVAVLVGAILGPNIPGGPRHAAERTLAWIVALLPLGIVAGARWLGRHRPFRWLLRRPQPSTTVMADGLEICLPDVGCRAVAWEEIGRLTRSRLTLREKLMTLDPPFDLTDPDGRVILRLGYGLAAPDPSPWHATPRTLAEVVVEHRPDRFGLLTAPRLTRHLEFALLADTPSQAAIQRVKRRRRMGSRLFVIGSIALSIVLTIWLVSHAAP